MKSFLFFLSSLLLIGLSITGASCQKETDCKATVKCVDASGNAVSGAEVILYAPVKDPNDPKGTTTYTGDVKASGSTDASGNVSFVFKLPAIFDATAKKVTATATFTGFTTVKLEAGSNVEKTVTLQ